MKGRRDTFLGAAGGVFILWSAFSFLKWGRGLADGVVINDLSLGVEDPCGRGKVRGAEGVVLKGRGREEGRREGRTTGRKRVRGKERGEERVVKPFAGLVDNITALFIVVAAPVLYSLKVMLCRQYSLRFALLLSPF